MMDFPMETIALNHCYRNDALLADMRGKASNPVSLEKVTQAYGEVVFPDPPADRPHVVSSIVLSSDGKMAFTDNPAGPVIAKNNFLDPQGALTDFWVLNVLRAYSDGVIIGARTLQNEPHNTSQIFDPVLVEQRMNTLQRPGKHPVSIVVSFDATDIPMDHLIFTIDPDEQYSVAIATSPEGAGYVEAHFPRPVRRITPEIIATEGYTLFDPSKPLALIVTGDKNRPDAPDLLSLLRKTGMERLLIESPSYTAHLMGLGMLDEFFINYSMVYAGGTFTPNVASPFSSTVHPHADLAMVGLHRSNFMFTRQCLRYGNTMAEDLGKLKY
jgi:riboflavin biosynthesis pyrimidine reductase